MDHYIEGPDEAGFYNVSGVKTPDGNTLKLRSELLAQNILFELELDTYKEEQFSILSICSNFIDNDQKYYKKKYIENIESMIVDDHTLAGSPPGPEVIDWLEQLSFVNDYFQSNDLPRVTTGRPESHREYLKVAKSKEIIMLITHFEKILDSMVDYEIETLHQTLHLTESLVLSVLFIKEYCTPQQLIRTNFASQFHFTPKAIVGNEKDISLEDLRVDFDFAIKYAGNISQFLEESRKDDPTFKYQKKYLKIFSEPENELKEYKSSLRTPLGKDASTKQLQHEVLKAICGLCNHKGGTLFIGVNDDGKVVGIEVDNYKSRDEFERTLGTIIENRIITTPKTDAADLVEFEYINFLRDKTVCKVKCKCLREPDLRANVAFLKDYKDGTEKAYKRGKSKNKELAGRALLAHQKEVEKAKSK